MTTEPEPAQKEAAKVAVPSATSAVSLALNTGEEKASSNSAARSAPAKKVAAPDMGNAQGAPPQQQKAGGLVLKETEEPATEAVAQEPE